MDAWDKASPKVLITGGKTIVQVGSGRGEELRHHLASHNVGARVRPEPAGPYESVEVEAGADPEVVRAIVESWEG